MDLNKLIRKIVQDAIKEILPPILSNELNQFKMLNDESEVTHLIGIDEVCRMTGYRKQSIYCMVSDNRIPYIKPAGTKFLRFNKEEILDWMENGRRE